MIGGAFICLLLTCFFHAIRGNESAGENEFSNPATSSNITVYIEHSFDQIHFLPRTRMQLISKADGKQGMLYLEKNVIAGDSLQLLKKLVDKNGLYTLRLRTEKPNWNGTFALTSIPVCALQRSAFKEDMQMFLDINGNINGLSYTVPPMTIAHECDSSKLKDAIQLQTRLRIGDETKAQPIPLQLTSNPPPYLQHVRLSPEENQQGGPVENKTFFQRYWYIIMGLMFYLMLSGGNGGQQGPVQEGNADNNGRQQQQQARK